MTKTNNRWWIEFNHPERGIIQVPFEDYGSLEKYKQSVIEEFNWEVISIYSENPLEKKPLIDNKTCSLCGGLFLHCDCCIKKETKSGM